MKGSLIVDTLMNLNNYTFKSRLRRLRGFSGKQLEARSSICWPELE